MPLPVRLKAVVDEMEFGTEEWRAFINRKTGELASFPGDTLRAAEDDEAPTYAGEFEPEDLENCRRVLADEDFIDLPGKEDIREYDIMERFSLSYPDEDLRERLHDAIDGRGAFRRFKNLIHRKGIADEWYRYREVALEKIAADFLEAHDIPYVDEGQRGGPPDTEPD
jgi:hypothetical protein